MTAQMAPKKLGTAPAPSIDEAIEARVAGYVGPSLAELTRRIQALEIEIAKVREIENRDRWPMMMPPKVAADYLGVSKTTLNALVDQGLIEATIPYGMEQRYYTREALDAWRLRSQ